jgi:hypothetical protein
MYLCCYVNRTSTGTDIAPHSLYINECKTTGTLFRGRRLLKVTVPVPNHILFTYKECKTTLFSMVYVVTSKDNVNRTSTGTGTERNSLHKKDVKLPGVGAGVCWFCPLNFEPGWDWARRLGPTALCNGLFQQLLPHVLLLLLHMSRKLSALIRRTFWIGGTMIKFLRLCDLWNGLPVLNDVRTARTVAEFKLNYRQQHKLSVRRRQKLRKVFAAWNLEAIDVLARSWTGRVRHGYGTGSCGIWTF